MRLYETVALVAALLTIVGIFATEVLRRHRGRSGRLAAPMMLALRIFLGIVFAVLGVVGSLLPVLQGWIFFLLAFLVLFPESRFAVRILDKAEPKMPRLVAALRRFGIGKRRESDTIAAE